MKKLIANICILFLLASFYGCDAETTSDSSESSNSIVNEDNTSNSLSDIATTTIVAESEPNHYGESSPPYSSSAMIGKSYDHLTDELKNSGFSNISYDIIDDLIIGFLVSDGEVEKVTINGETNFSETDWFPSDSEIIISYHTFPSNGESKNDTNDNSNDDEILNIYNCPDLANILSMKADSDPAYESFSQTYEGKTIEFDGRIDYIANHGNYDTRYDFLVSAGDYDPDHQSGPTFKLEDIGSSSFSSISSNVLHIGDNVHIKAIVGRCDSEHCLFYLESPIITDR